MAAAPIIPPSIAEKARELYRLMNQKDELEEQLKKCNASLMRLRQQELPKLLADAEIEKVTVEGAGTLYTKQEFFCSMVKGEPVEGDETSAESPFYDYARNNAPDLIVDYIHPARLKSWAKEKLEQGEALPNSLNTSFQTHATLLRKKQKNG